MAEANKSSNLSKDDVSCKKNALKLEIDELILKIRNYVKVEDKERLLMAVADLSLVTNLVSEGNAITSSLESSPKYYVEYLQSIIVSEDDCCNTSALTVGQLEEIASRYFGDFDRLFKLVLDYLICWGFDEISMNSDHGIDILEAQALFMVRGMRYQFLQHDYFAPLISAHSNELERLFGISAIQLMEGLDALERSLSQGIGDLIMELQNSMQSLEQNILCENNAFDISILSDDKRSELKCILLNIFGVDRYNVEQISGWPDKLLRELSYGPGEAKFSDSGYDRWPIISLPVQERPFIRLKGVTYCFDYNSLFDNFYRALQRAVLRLDPSYRQEWQINQQSASEGAVANLFSKILPGARILRNNFYGPKKKRCENDLLVIYADQLIIVEIKSGQFTGAPPFTNFESHKRKYNNLITGADSQCVRLMDYIRESNGIFPIYDQHGKLVTELNIGSFSDITAMSITIENVNGFAARASKVPFMNVSRDAISIAFDDLLTYEAYFDSSCEFLHFFKERKVAAQHPRLSLFDELDHLGMYIDYNLYSMEADDISRADVVLFDGCRLELDQYFYKFKLPCENVKKPIQLMPPMLQKIIRFLDESESKNKVATSSYLLNFSYEARGQFNDVVELALDRLRTTKIQSPVFFGGNAESIRMTVFVKQLSLPSKTKNQMLDYVWSLILVNQEAMRSLLVLTFDEEDHLKDVDLSFQSFSNVPQKEIARLREEGKKICARLVARHVEMYGKIGRNHRCPCGSGKKYKRCHGR